MNKYTINKAFEKDFPHPIWKIEVDCTNNRIAIEYRDPSSTLPYFSVCTFEGEPLLDEYKITEKEWTLEAIQGDFLILKRFGENSPIQSGIQVIHFPSATIVSCYMEYVLKEVLNDYLLTSHRSIPAGLPFYINIHTGEVSNKIIDEATLPSCLINFPITFHGVLPKFIQNIEFKDQIWLQSHQDYFIWSYHLQEKDTYNLYLSLSTKDELFDTKIILKGLDKLIPQPYFQVKEYIFFLSGNKREIAAYLV